jgi:hypothetical protein
LRQASFPNQNKQANQGDGLNFSEFRQKAQNSLKAELPSGESIQRTGRSIAEDITIGRFAFMDKMGVASEREYKEQCIRNN